MATTIGGLIKRIDLSDLVEEFAAHDKENYFSAEGLENIFAHVDGKHSEAGIFCELDVQGLCLAYEEITVSDVLHRYDVRELNLADFEAGGSYGISYAEYLEDMAREYLEDYSRGEAYLSIHKNDAGDTTFLREVSNTN